MRSIQPSTTSANSVAPVSSYTGTKTRVRFAGSCLKQNKTTYTYGKMVNIYIVYEINLWNCTYTDDPTLGNSLFGAAKLVKKC